jgi:dTDP-4-dehydrorhamnose reductase
MHAGLRPTTLVLGASGFLGAHVASACRGEIVCASRAVAPSSRGRHRPFDAERPGELERLLVDERPARVVNVAALSSVPEAEADPDRAHAVNAELPRRLASWCEEAGARLVHVSTDLVFGGREPVGDRYREEDPPSPVSTYGRSKAAGEALVLAASPRALVVRLPLLYGNSSGRARGASDGLLDAIARGERPVLLTDEWRTPLEVGNAARALAELAEGEERGILNVAGPDRVSRHELGLAVLVANGRTPQEALRLMQASTRAESGWGVARARDVSLDTRRARSLLRTPLLAIREGLAVA